MNTSQDRTRIALQLARLAPWLGGQPVRFAQVSQRPEGGYRLDDAAVERIQAKLAGMQAKQLQGGPLLIPAPIRAALEYFGIAVPQIQGGPVDADGHSFTRE